jgi:CheY-like chemotaxis protein/HPt (histidine-containing phosphotransfer) domain-containing protein
LENLAVLLVDANPTSRAILVETLKAWRVRPVAVEPEAARRELESARGAGRAFPLVVVDASSPTSGGIAFASEVARTPGLAGATIVMLPPAVDPQDRARLTSAGVKALVTTPLKRSELLDSIVRVMQVEELPLGGETGASEGLVTVAMPGSVSATAAHSANLLVAEDHPVNQRLVTRVLEKLGHRVTLVGNGRDALDELERREFDAVLMDVQMPVMGGLEAVAELRRREVQTGRRTPVIAMTAHAMDGDRERCLSAGMDSYVSKPVRQAQLAKAINDVLGSEAATGTLLLDEPGMSDVLAVDTEALLHRCGDDLHLLTEVVELFLNDWPVTLMTLREAVDVRDGPRVAGLAHKLRGALGVFDADIAVGAALSMENLAKAGEWGGVRETLRQLESSVGKLVPALQELTRKVQSP